MIADKTSKDPQGNSINPLLTAVRCAVVKLDINGTATYYDEKIWVDDPNEDDGGTFQYIKKKYDKPKVILNFVGEVDIDLIVSGTYTDGLNMFVAIDKNKIQNCSTHIDSFKIPKELVCVGKPYCG
jgi:hypothetical protein